MKTRTGHVSNSSTSSFIIAFKDDKKICPTCGRSDPDILDMVEKSGCEDNHVDGIGTEHILYMINRSYEDGEFKDDIIKKIKPYEGKKDWRVAEITLSNHDDIIRPVLDDMVERGEIKLLNRDG